MGCASLDGNKSAGIGFWLRGAVANLKMLLAGLKNIYAYIRVDIFLFVDFYTCFHSWLALFLNENIL